MTRINVVSVQELTQKHLCAEYREITRLPGNLYAWLNRKTKAPDINEIPPEYVLGTGHVKFFFTRMKYLENRFEQIINEMLRRGYKPKYTDSSIFKNVPIEYYNDYEPTDHALLINRQRILDRSK